MKAIYCVVLQFIKNIPDGMNVGFSHHTLVAESEEEAFGAAYDIAEKSGAWSNHLLHKRGVLSIPENQINEVINQDR